jgi:hypothetical protein
LFEPDVVGFHERCHVRIVAARSVGTRLVILAEKSKP